MASSKALIISLLLSVPLLLYVLQAADDESSVIADDIEISLSLPQNGDIDCDSACDARCSETKRQKICKRACGTCCDRCHCVPPGTSGNEDVCPCYANMTTHGGRHKCP